MIQFVTFFVAMVTGVHPVALLVDTARVSAVEVRLDTRAVARLTGPPWEAACDFGAEIRPHVLEAVAFDAGGAEVSRIEQWVNLPRAHAEAGLMVRVAGGHPVAHLTWSEAEGRRPEQVLLFLDGEPVEAGDPAAVRLPDSVLEGPHVLRADVVFGANDIAHASLAFGLGFFDHSEGELTAVPFVAGGGGVPDPRAMKGWFTAGGRALTPSLVEKGQAEVIFVVAASAAGRIPLLGERPIARSRRVLLDEIPGESVVGAVLPVPHRTVSGAGAESWVFPLSSYLRAEQVSPRVLLNLALLAEKGRDRQELPVAVALAGVEACASGRRRAVVLVLGNREDGEGERRAGEIGRFLAELHVPLLVWRLSSDPRPGQGWPAETVIDRSTFRRAMVHLSEVLESQRIVWLLGHVPPNTVQLSAEARARGHLAP